MEIVAKLSFLIMLVCIFVYLVASSCYNLDRYLSNTEQRLMSLNSHVDSVLISNSGSKCDSGQRYQLNISLEEK